MLLVACMFAQCLKFDQILTAYQLLITLSIQTNQRHVLSIMCFTCKVLIFIHIQKKYIKYNSSGCIKARYFFLFSISWDTILEQ
ncbi:hypothetical protein pb186bvf_006457 [Paramecium bursaria]